MQNPVGAYPALHAVGRVVHPQSRTSKGGTSTSANNNDQVVYDIKFYPYTEPDDDAVFAVVVGREVTVYRLTADSKNPFEILRSFRDPQEDISLNSIAWFQDLETGDPMLAFAGSHSSKIKLANVTTGSVTRNLSGHGAAINDLVISPLSPSILASASNDHSIRLWNLDPAYSKQPCAALFAGSGHKEHVLALAFHQKGQYLLSGGTDTIVNLWAVPPVPDANAGTDKVTQVYYPLFSTNEIHSDYVDCLHFHGDLIISHAATSSNKLHKNANTILIWTIDGFNSNDDVPADPPLPGPNVYTRSAFGGRFQRLLTLDMPDTMPFYLRFSVWDAPGSHPMLVMGNQKSKFSFWDLEKLETGPTTNTKRTATKKRNGSYGRGRGRGRSGARGGNMVTSALGRDAQAQAQAQADEGAAANEDGDDATSTGTPADSRSTPIVTEPISIGFITKTVNSDKDTKLNASDPFKPIPPHHTVTVPKYNFLARQVAWSNCGKWLVAAGEIGLMVVMKRWE